MAKKKYWHKVAPKKSCEAFKVGEQMNSACDECRMLLAVESSPELTEVEGYPYSGASTSAGIEVNLTGQVCRF